ncbi:sulfite exporter TauE/SafE family protein [Nocardioides ungokensis]|uniref:sulfite exporter TauE/SafE family protein n=1 Tax=Nocardioides ungokensis TaxID=1643322 RepID=UPI0015DF6422|nr:sulfite exporter TauE/SafE family protein [Nocardioides ungokensis]
MDGVPWDVVALIGAVTCVGAFVQSVVGLGLGLLVAPVVAMVEPGLVPALPLWLALMISGSMLLGERRHVDWGALAWALPARVPGTIVGAWLVVTFSDQAIAVAIGVMVLVAVVVTLRTVHVPVNPASLTAAGVVAGVSGTATSIGGPPIALLFQRREPEVVRSTLSVFFFLGVVVSLVGLAWSGSLTEASWHLGLLLAPLVALGAFAGSAARDRVPRDRFRVGVLLVCAASALALLVQALV